MIENRSLSENQNFVLFLVNFQFRAKVKKVTSRAELKILQLGSVSSLLSMYVRTINNYVHITNRMTPLILIRHVICQNQFEIQLRIFSRVFLFRQIWIIKYYKSIIQSNNLFCFMCFRIFFFKQSGILALVTYTVLVVI